MRTYLAYIAIRTPKYKDLFCQTLKNAGFLLPSVYCKCWVGTSQIFDAIKEKKTVIKLNISDKLPSRSCVKSPLLIFLCQFLRSQNTTKNTAKEKTATPATKLQSRQVAAQGRCSYSISWKNTVWDSARVALGNYV